MLSKLGGLWDVLERDPTCRCVILTGAGQRTFTVGTDISDDCRPVRKRRAGESRLAENDAYSKPIVAAFNGDCIGGDLERLLSTDIRATVPEARFGLPEVKWAIYPFGGRVPHRYGRESRRTARIVTALGRSGAGAGGGGVSPASTVAKR
jgi:enoyl-CoA hydratase/carnithine racemase